MVKLLGKNSARQNWELPDRTEALQEDREGVSMPARSLFIFSSRGSSRKQLPAKSKTEEFSLAFNGMSTYPCARPKRRSEAPNWWKGEKSSEKMVLLIIQFSALLSEKLSQICCNGSEEALHFLSRMELLIRSRSPFKWTSVWLEPKRWSGCSTSV